MRKVRFNKWIPQGWIKSDTGVSQHVKGTGCWETGFLHTGTFHQWANAYEESSEGFGNYTVALVELQNGEIIQVLPTNIKFT